jgi:hypothetical protein
VHEELDTLTINFQNIQIILTRNDLRTLSQATEVADVTQCWLNDKVNVMLYITSCPV